MPTPSDPFWIAIGDLHGSAQRLLEVPGAAEANGILVTGDITNAGGPPEARKVLDTILAVNPSLFAQIGNMDRPELTDWLGEQGWNTHGCVRELAPDIAIMGLGGSTFTPFGTPSEFPESRFADWLENMWRQAREYRHVILVSHTPPYDTLCDVVNDTTHVGSVAVREFILECQPDVCLCGHIHESRAVDRIGRTVVVNPGALGAGGYVVVRFADGRLVPTRHMLESVITR